MNIIEKTGLLLLILGCAAVLETAIDDEERDALGTAAVIVGIVALLLGDLVL